MPLKKEALKKLAIKNLKGRAEIKADTSLGGQKFNKKFLETLKKDGYFVDKFFKIKFKNNSKKDNRRGCRVEDILKVCSEWIKKSAGNKKALKLINQAISEIERD